MVSAMISGVVFMLLTFIVFFDSTNNNIYGLSDIRYLTLDKCLVPFTYHWYRILPIYAFVVSVAFFCKISNIFRQFPFLAIYMVSLFLFWKKSKNLANIQNNLSRIQKRIFVTVSIALFSMAILYSVPSILHVLAYVSPNLFCKVIKLFSTFN